jgi:pseudouridine synthase
MIRAGRVAIDGQVITALGSKADPSKQRITLDGQPLPQAEHLEYWLVHKPKGVVTTAKDPQGRPSILGLLPSSLKARLYPVGRLDINSEGLVLLTNDGDLAQRLTHPRHKVPKTYKVWIRGLPPAAALESLRHGVPLEDGPSAPARVFLKSAGPQRSKLSFVLYEGRKRQIRRMCEQVGHPVLRLVRVGMGPLKLGDLPSGAARPLTRAEVQRLKKAVPISGCNAPGDGVKKLTRRQAPQKQGSPSGTRPCGRGRKNK